MKKLLISTIMAVVLLLPNYILAQVTINGVQKASPGDLIVLVPMDAEESRTIWNLNSPETFEHYQEENGKLFIAMPNKRLSFSLLVIPNDVTKPIQNIRHVIVVAEGSTPVDPPDTPVDPPTDPSEDFTDSPLYNVTKQLYSDVFDPEKAKWGDQMSRGFDYISKNIEEGKYSDITQMMVEVQEVNRGETFGEVWPAISRVRWGSFRSGIANELDKLEDLGSLNTAEDYRFHFKAIALALKESV